MQILSVEFTLFLTGSILLLAVANRLAWPWLMALTGMVFLAIMMPWSLVFFGFSAVSVWWLIRTGSLSSAAWLAGLSILAVLFVVNKWLTGQGPDVSPAWMLATIGVSYLIPKAIHLLTEVYKGKVESLSFSGFLAWLFFPLTMPAGPIHGYPDFETNRQAHSWSLDQVSEGLERLLFGYFKIVVLANFLVSMKFNQWLNSGAVTDPGLAGYLDCIRYGANLYFQFSGFTDIILGAGLLAGFRLPENFNFPFLAVNINEFWKRWHMSLTDWTKRYVFFPIFAQTRNAYIGVICTMLVIGLWHELSWRYLLWALYHGAAIAIWQWYRSVRPAPESSPWWKRAISIVFTLQVVILSFAITKEHSLEKSLTIYTDLFHTIGRYVFFFM
ncbi:MAG: MBOAT family protein [Bacteroidetes bacterium]|nr:MBOAT family protein [Bacteroidota bacterium]